VTRRTGTGPAGAGVLLITSILVCAAAGLGIGALVGTPLVLALVGGAIGVGVGFWNVYSRFKDI
jgi:Putative F0F1-ATPase subunit Ca2+/Mg2+ transporter